MLKKLFGLAAFGYIDVGLFFYLFIPTRNKLLIDNAFLLCYNKLRTYVLH